MNRFLETSSKWFRYFLFLLTTVIIIYIIPKSGQFQFDFEKGEPWQYKDLRAPFKFPVQKSDERLAKEKQAVREKFKPFYRETDKSQSLKKGLLNTFERAYQQLDSPPKQLSFYQSKIDSLWEIYYSEGVVASVDKHQQKKDFEIRVVEENVAQTKSLDEFNTIPELRQIFQTELARKNGFDRSALSKVLESSLEPNIVYDRELSSQKLQEMLNEISTHRGLVKEGEKIIAQGELVTDDKYQKLHSLQQQYDEQVVEGTGYWMLWGGYSLLIMFIMLIFAVYINNFKTDVFRSTKSILMILINVLVFILLSVYVEEANILNIYIIPYAIVPIVLLAFFGPRIAVMAHLMIVLIVSLFLSNGLEFVFLQVMAGFMSILAMSKIRYLSQFFIASILIVFSYYINFIGLKFIEIGSFQSVEWTNLLWFTGNFILTLLAYPLIYAHEKLFGFVTDITLIEFSDISKKVLRKLSMRAPGTFQHSLQVANISETVINEIGGNALLTRVGALYHDIGKMDQPEYFVENQQYLENPHNSLAYEESAKIIINHVPKGVEKARYSGLPEQITKFIRTHHGTSRVEYFYRNFLKQNKEEEVDENKFRYPGPKPFSKETAVVMLVDSVEAASRSKTEPSERELDELIDNIIDNKIRDEQLEKADITMREINIIRNRLKKLMKSIYHVRVKYPDEVKKEEKD